MSPKAHWSKDADYSKTQFFIRRMDTSGYIKPAEAPSFLSDTKPFRFLSAPLHQGFWFDEGAFMGMLFNMLEISFEKGDQVFVEKGLDLMLSRIRPEHSAAIPPAVKLFLEAVFDRERLPGSIAAYAEDQSYFSRLFKKETGMTPSAFRKMMQV